MTRRVWTVLVAALIVNAMLIGATWDQTIKQLPARQVIGVEAFSAYSQAADLRNGVAWYATLGIAAALLALAAALLALVSRPRPTGTRRAMLVVAALATAGHMAVTASAAPLNFSQRDHTADVDALTRTFDQFAQLNLLRAVLQTLVVAALAWILLARHHPATPETESTRP
ncbi:hypothetical protein [Actinophytocola sp.]|uniref:hypothetical protein n=1 Tax=Actinophytocola sp. TaxID=1872138 RepID=UPI003D6B9412